MNLKKINTRFQLHDQNCFAKASGDYNPLHLDEKWCRRTVIGEVVVHGIHAVLWALEEYFNENEECSGIDNIFVEFIDYISLDMRINLVIIDLEKHKQLLKVVDDESRLLIQIKLELTPHLNQVFIQEKHLFKKNNVSVEAKSLKFEDIASLKGKLFLNSEENEIQSRLPNCKRVLGNARIALLMSLSWLVGMECPGRYSLFKSFKLNLNSFKSLAKQVSWSVVRTSKPLVFIRLDDDDLNCEVVSFYLHRGVSQATMKEVCEKVPNNVFNGQRALIIGGSRGLGELTAKIIASGGGEPTITWYKGASDAERVVREIKELGFKAQRLFLDVTENISLNEFINNSLKEIDSLFYFASPKITSRQSPEQYKIFYIDCFENLCKCIAANQKIKIFYPSTIYTEKAPEGLEEYSSIKLKGEKICSNLSNELGLKIFAPRLPKLATDQNLTLFGSSGKETLTSFLPYIEEFQSDDAVFYKY